MVIFGGAVAADAAYGTANDAMSERISRIRFTVTPKKVDRLQAGRQSLGTETSGGERDPTAHVSADAITPSAQAVKPGARHS
jgi:hypothetical protein